MRRALPLLAALLLLVSAPGVALQADAPRAGESAPARATETVTLPGVNDTTAHLHVDAGRSAVVDPSVGVGAALSMDGSAMESKLAEYTLEERLAAEQSSAKKEQTVLEYKYHVESRLSALQNYRKSLRQEFNDGRLSPREYAYGLAAVDAEAEALRDSIGRLESSSERISGLSFYTRNMNATVQTLEGPVTERVDDVVRGRTGSTRIYVGTSDVGTALSMIADGRYVREAYRSDNRNLSRTSSGTIYEVGRQVLTEQYPWVMENRTRMSSGIYSPLNFYPTTIHHEQGTLTAHVDVGTRKIFGEIQRKRLGAFPTGEPIRNATTGISIAVNRTYPGGPLHVTLTDSDGNAVDAPVSVDGRTVGTTGDDGELWTVAPGETFTVSARRGLNTVSVTLTPDGVTPVNSTVAPPES
ncbi:DUF7094 domain-containing protein [Halomicrococcus gelatinilyticus]|uniref:DUF7094 domain-containing protein n=1 Tax=Halomicrococcus gelatinilyticus TaxID=1702103 RepID=UPI002E11ACC9